MLRRKKDAFTLIELLIVIAIMGLLIQMILPAVQAAREAARRTSCQNNLRQLGLAATHHADAHGHWPTGGWGFSWVGDPDRGYGKDQPGGWAFAVLPYLEQHARRDLAKGGQAQQKRRLLAQMCTTPIEGFNCPSRRASGPHSTWLRHGPFNAQNSDETPLGQIRGDYAMNGGARWPVLWNVPKLPETLEEGDDPEFKWPEEVGEQDGVVFMRTPIRLEQVSDGLSNVYLLGEKALSYNDYENGHSQGDNLSLFQGYDWDVVRWASPKGWGAETVPETDGVGDQYRAFGSAHGGGFNMVNCDGSVHFVNCGIDQDFHARQAMRADEGAPIP